MKKIIFISIFFIAQSLFAQWGAIITGAATVAAPLIQTGLDKRKEKKMLKNAGCFDDKNQKIAEWEEHFTIPALDLDAAEIQYKASKNQ